MSRSDGRAATWVRSRGSTIGRAREPGLQLAMVALVVAELVLRDAERSPGVLVPSAAVLAAATTTTMLVPGRAGSDPVPRCQVVAAGNLLCFGLLLAAAPDLATGALVVLTLTYMGRLMPMRGVAVAAAAVPTLYLGPSLVLGRTDLWQPVVLAAAGLLISFVVAATCWAWGVDAQDRDHQQSVVQTLVETVDAGLVLMDADGRFRLVNPRHRDFIALVHPETEGSPGDRFEGHVYAADRVTPLPPDDRPSARAAAGEEFAGEVITAGEPGGVDQRALAVSARAIRDEQGRWRGAVLAYHDVTAAMQALQAKDDFITMVSHELRTPLTSIAGYLDLAQDTAGVPDPARAHLAVAVRNTQRMARLVDDLLDAAGATRGSLEVALAPVRLTDLVTDVVAELTDHARQAGITLRTELDEVPVVLADASRMSQVVENLVSNAITYAGDSEEVRLQVGQVGEAVRIVVVDQGIGMTPEELAEAFARFFRSAALSDQSIAGVGVGLAISRSIVDRHGGRIWLESRPGRGTTAVVELPVPRDPQTVGPGTDGAP